ncbi:hypothetical protein B0O80DRAFT_425030 [Mortierella sp. GBAus27b]|nr:hypothetical protein BGX31_005049 [Mortierella sp. GBA43]KAI8357124.1 hypothetical protein B0O80DRAFT_425030 [Mortierella sp. GBAus27b]
MTDITKKIALTNADSWLGCCVAYHLAERLEQECKGLELVCLARRPEVLSNLSKYKNVRIQKVDYEDESTLKKAFEGGIRCAILIPEHDKNRVQHARTVLEAMGKVLDKGCLLISAEGADESPLHLKDLQSYREIEKEVEQCQIFLILRRSILNQCFLLWSKVVREHATFPISTPKQSQFVPLDMSDLVCAIDTIIVENYHHGDGPECIFGDHKNKTYTLTGPEQVTPEGIVHDLSDIVGKEIKLEEVDRKELKKYIESLREDDEWNEDVDLNWCQFPPRDRRGAHDYDRPHDNEHEHDRDRHMTPNEASINLFLDELELIGDGGSGTVSGDLAKILGHSGKTTKAFLQKEKDVFKSRRV